MLSFSMEFWGSGSADGVGGEEICSIDCTISKWSTNSVVNQQQKIEHERKTNTTDGRQIDRQTHGHTDRGRSVHTNTGILPWNGGLLLGTAFQHLQMRLASCRLPLLLRGGRNPPITLTTVRPFGSSEKSII